jgi:hypothetical protein
MLSLGGIVYCLGLAAAAIGGVAHLYVGSVAFVIGSMGVPWVFGSIRSRARGVDALYEDLASVFSVPYSTYREVVLAGYQRACSFRAHVMLGLVFGALVTAVAYLIFFNHPAGVPHPWVFKDAWFEPPIGWKFGITLCFAWLIAFSLAVPIWILSCELLLIRKLARLSPIPLAEAVRRKVRPLADLHIKSAMDWSWGATLFAIMLGRSPGSLSITFVGILVLFAAVVFLYPQVVLGMVIARAHDRACRLAVHAYELEIQASSLSQSERVRKLAELMEATTPPKLWVYGLDGFIQWGGAQIVATAALALQIASARSGSST